MLASRVASVFVSSLLLLSLLGVLVAPGTSFAERSFPEDSVDDRIRPQDVAERADLLAVRLEADRVTTGAQAGIGDVDKALLALEPEILGSLARARTMLAGSPSLLSIQDLIRELDAASEPLRGWRAQVEAESRRTADVLDDLERARGRWARTLAHPETVAAGPAVIDRVQRSVARLDDALTQVRAWRERVHNLEGRLLDHGTAVNDAIARLGEATLAEGTSLFVADRPPLWSRGFFAKLPGELARAPGEFSEFHRSTIDYLFLDARPFLLQALLAVVLAFALTIDPAVVARRLATAPVSEAARRVLERPWSIAMLLALMTTDALHPSAPQRVTQFLGLVAIVPAARVVTLIHPGFGLPLFAGLLVLFLLDRLAIAMSELPEVALVFSFLARLLGIGLALSVRRVLIANGSDGIVARLLKWASVGVGLSILAEVLGWSSLSVLVGRGILAGGVTGVYVMAATVSLEGILAWCLASPALRRSRFVDRNQGLVQRWTAVALRMTGAAFWLRSVVMALGLRVVASNAFHAFLALGVSVGALSITIGGVLAFAATLAASMVASRIVQEVLADEILTRINLPRGMPHALLALTRYATWILGFLLALAAGGVELSQLGILLGGLGVGIGLGLQDVVKNFAAGITLLLERRVHVGDAVRIPDREVFGRVLSIGMRASVVRNWNGTEVVMPNDDLVSGAVTNLTLSDRMQRVEVTVGVDYGSDPEAVLALLLRVAAAEPRLLGNPGPTALFTGFGESSLDFALKAWTDQDYEKVGEITSDLRIAVHHAIQAAGLTIPFPRRDVHLIRRDGSSVSLPGN